MKTTTEHNVQVGHEDIAELARQMWEREGRQVGKDLEYWLRAERQLLSRSDRASKMPPIQATDTSDRSQRRSESINLPDSTREVVRI
jgi:Protein of unknown function (DUF2934)